METETERLGERERERERERDTCTRTETIRDWQRIGEKGESDSRHVFGIEIYWN